MPGVPGPGVHPVEGVAPRQAGVPGDLPGLLQAHLLLQVPVPVHTLPVGSRRNPDQKYFNISRTSKELPGVAGVVLKVLRYPDLTVGVGRRVPARAGHVTEGGEH